MGRICRRPSIPSGLLLGVLCASVPGVAYPKDDGTDTSMTVERAVESNVIEPDGTFVMTYEEMLRINEERAVKRYAQIPISYNRMLETVEIVEAYTHKADGRRIKVQPDQIKDQQESRSSGAPMFQDTRAKTIIFPEVAVGDRLFLQFKKARTTPLFPGQYEALFLPSFLIIKQLQLIYDVPESVRLHAEAKGFSGSTSSSGPGRRRYQWDYVPSERQRIESGAVSYIDYGDRLFVSTFASFSEFAAAYESRAKDKVEVTPKIRQLAQQVTKGLTESRAKALALSDWVRKNIRYVAVYVGPGGVVPHASETVLNNRYGDCKDHVALLEALLAAVDIDSTSALIALGSSYRLQEIPTLGVLNHVITYVPSLNLFLDSTAEGIAGGYLPLSELDKSVILTKTGQVMRTPATQRNATINKTEYRISVDGAADFKHASTVSGWEAEATRYLLRNVKPSDRDLAVERILQRDGQKGSGTIDVGNVDGTGDEYQIKIGGHSENLLNLPGPIGMPVIGFGGGVLQAVAGFTSEKERTRPFVCPSREVEDESTFIVPKEISVVAVPKPLALRDAYFDYASEYIRQDNFVVIKRRFRFHHAGMVCSSDDFKAILPAVSQMVRDLRSQVIVQGQ